MSRTRMLSAIGLVGLSLLVMGCPKKAPEAPPPPPPPPVTVPPPQEVAPQPAPVVDETPDPWDAEIEELNAMAASQGLLGDVYFDFDKFDLRPDARERLAKNAEFMRQHPNFQFTVEGHCDERGTNEYNITLGQSRSSAAVGYLKSLGVSNAMRTISYGEERPVCTESGEPCWQRNRRARFVITSK
jgi:peptidoglycan-associated lipoprotein